MLEGEIAADYMNRYYTHVGENSSKNFKENWVEIEFFEELNKRQFSFNFITESMIKNILKLMPLNKSSCIEYLNSRIICDGMAEMLTETTFMINECIRSEVMPVKWKIGYITPMTKGKALKNPGDWRPVPVLPLPSKIIERAVYNQLVYHYECNNYLCINQHGFKKGHSTASAIFECVQFLYDNFDCSNITSSIFRRSAFHIWLEMRGAQFLSLLMIGRPSLSHSPNQSRASNSFTTFPSLIRPKGW